MRVDGQEGSIVRDTVWFNSLKPDVAFGVVDSQFGRGWSERADGIVGFGFATLVRACVRCDKYIYSLCVLMLPPTPLCAELHPDLCDAVRRSPLRGCSSQSFLVRP